MPLTKALSMPLMAVAISATEQMPMTMPSMVRIERALLARMAAREISSPSFHSNR